MSDVESTAGHFLWISLIHYPVLNRERDVIATAITNLDVHDIARSARTYGVRRYYLVTPIERQRVLAERIVEHWCEGHGAQRVPERGEALQLVRTAEGVEGVINAITAEIGEKPLVVASCARLGRATMSFAKLRGRLQDRQPTLLLLGTGWGLADEAFAFADEVLDPILAPGVDYNHLSVRCAAAIMLDRLLGANG